MQNCIPPRTRGYKAIDMGISFPYQSASDRSLTPPIHETAAPFESAWIEAGESSELVKGTSRTSFQVRFPNVRPPRRPSLRT